MSCPPPYSIVKVVVDDANEKAQLHEAISDYVKFQSVERSFLQSNNAASPGDGEAYRIDLTLYPVEQLFAHR